MSGPSRYAPASSAWSKPTRTLGSCCRANFPSTWSSAAGLSLDAQPAALTVAVRRTVLVSDMEDIVEEGVVVGRRSSAERQRPTTYSVITSVTFNSGYAWFH